jgi:hypothetical protein
MAIQLYSALAIIPSLFRNTGRVCVRWSPEAKSRVGQALSVDAPAGVVGEACGEAATWELPILATHHLRVNSVKLSVYYCIHHYTSVYYISVAYSGNLWLNNYPAHNHVDSRILEIGPHLQAVGCHCCLERPRSTNASRPSSAICVRRSC